MPLVVTGFEDAIEDKAREVAKVVRVGMKERIMASIRMDNALQTANGVCCFEKCIQEGNEGRMIS